VPGPSPGLSSRGGQKPEGGAKNRKGGPHFVNAVLDVCHNRGAKREMGVAPISNGGGPGTTAPPLATALLCACAYGVKSEISRQKFRLTPVIQPPTLLRNVLYGLFSLTSVVQNVCVCTMDFVSAGKNTLLLLLYVIVCEKVVPRFNKHDDVIE